MPHHDVLCAKDVAIGGWLVLPKLQGEVDTRGRPDFLALDGLAMALRSLIRDPEDSPSFFVRLEFVQPS